MADFGKIEKLLEDSLPQCLGAVHETIKVLDGKKPLVEKIVVGKIALLLLEFWKFYIDEFQLVGIHLIVILIVSELSMGYYLIMLFIIIVETEIENAYHINLLQGIIPVYVMAVINFVQVSLYALFLNGERSIINASIHKIDLRGLLHLHYEFLALVVLAIHVVYGLAVRFHIGKLLRVQVSDIKNLFSTLKTKQCV